MNLGLNFGIGGGTGPAAGRGAGAVGGDLVFASPITGDTIGSSNSAVDSPAVWVIAGAFAVMVIIYAHWHVY